MRFWSSLFVIVVLDQWSKWMVAMRLEPGQSITVVPGIAWFTHVLNRGAAFSIMPGQTVFFIVAALLVVLALTAYNLWFGPGPILQLVTGIMAGGALGNLLDRCRFSGQVVDFIDFRVWPVFNVADIAIVCGGVLLVIYFIRFDKGEPGDG